MDTLWHTVHNVILHDILYSMSHTVYKPVIMKEWKIQSSTHKWVDVGWNRAFHSFTNDLKLICFLKWQMSGWWSDNASWSRSWSWCIITCEDYFTVFLNLFSTFFEWGFVLSKLLVQLSQLFAGTSELYYMSAKHSYSPKTVIVSVNWPVPSK